jgi:hypothetical protein
MAEVKTTKHTQLQATLNQWFDALLHIAEFRVTHKEDLTQLHRLIDNFARSFVPTDIDEEDTAHYTNNLLMDEEFFGALVREIGQCATGERVESIEESENRAVFFLFPPEGTMDANADFELFRELAFIKQKNTDNETVWRAEG